MPLAKRLVVGLGNPGEEYAGTRHNIGFRVVEALARELGIELSHEKQALVGWGRYRSYPVGLAKPLTYVNRSGEAVRRLLAEHDLSPEEVLVVVDDLHLDLGMVRLRPKGGSGGHNGLQSIIDRIGTQGFPRLRLGIGQDYRRGQQAEYVLSPFEPEEAPEVDAMVQSACEAALAYVSEGIDTAMNQHNS